MLRILIIGIGQCGNRILDSINKEALIRGSSIKSLSNSLSKYFSKYKFNSHVETIAINTAINDLKEMKYTKSKDRIHIKNLHGVGANRIYGKKVFEDQKEYIIKEIENRGLFDICFIITSASGGTGSSFTPSMIKLLKNKFEFPIYAVVILPFRKEGTLYLQNTIFTIKDLQDNKSDGIILADNQYLKSVSSNLQEAFDGINTMIAQRLLFLLDSLDNEMMMVTDLGDFKTVMKSGSGFSTIGYYKSEQEIDIKSAIRNAISPRGLLYSTDIYKEATRAMIIIKGDKKYLSLDSISNEIELLTESIGHVFKGIITKPNCLPEVLCIFTLGSTTELKELYNIGINAISIEKNKKDGLNNSKEKLIDYFYLDGIDPEY